MGDKKIDVTVSWDILTNKPVPSLDPVTVTKGQETKIVWNADSSILDLDIDGLNTKAEFKDQTRSSDKKKVTITDKATDSGNWAYTISATHVTGKRGKHDPKIQNNPD